MDTLSALLADIRIRDARFIRTHFDSPGQLAVRDVSQPCFHMVTQGRLWLRPTLEAAPIALATGDVAFFPRGQAHALCGQPVPPAWGACDMMAQLRTAGSPSGVLGLPTDHPRYPGTEGVGRSISGCMQIQGVADAWLWSALPPFLLVKWGDQALPDWLQIGLAYLDQELARDQLARQAIINRLGDILFIQSLRTYLETPRAGQAEPDGAPQTGWLMGIKDSMISKVITAMHRDPTRAWSLQDLARVGCVSRSVLAERFGDMMGLPPLAYLTRHRMQQAARQLAQSSASVAEVAQSAGYTSTAAFAQAFKREHGCSPSAYRSQASLADGV